MGWGGGGDGMGWDGKGGSIVSSGMGWDGDVHLEARHLLRSEAELVNEHIEILKVLPAMLLAWPAEARLGALQAEAALMQILEKGAARDAQVVRHQLLVLPPQLLWPQCELGDPLVATLVGGKRLRILRPVDKVHQILD